VEKTAARMPNLCAVHWLILSPPRLLVMPSHLKWLRIFHRGGLKKKKGDSDQTERREKILPEKIYKV